MSTPTTNHFRTRLANLTYSGPGDFIDSSFTAVTLPTNLDNVYNLLFPITTRSTVLLYTNAYTFLLDSFGLDSIFTLYSPVITYKLSDLYTFENNTVDLLAVSNTILNSSAANNMLADGLGLNYDNIYNKALPRLEKLAGLVAAYSYRLT